jgi:hypothetical protein
LRRVKSLLERDIALAQLGGRFAMECEALGAICGFNPRNGGRSGHALKVGRMRVRVELRR